MKYTDVRGKAVLVAGGTCGIGLGVALAFARQGAACILTHHRMGSADEGALRQRFASLSAPEPLILRADTGEAEDTDALLAEVKKRHERVEVLVSNVANDVIAGDLDELSEQALLKTVKYSTWPVVDYVRKMRRVFGAYPRYVIAMSSPGPDSYSPGYDYVAASQAALEATCRYLSYRLRNDDVRVNVIRASAIATESTLELFGKDLFEFFDRLTPPGLRGPSAEEVGDVAVALASGMLDAMSGQVITVDRGGLFCSTLMRLYAERKSLEL